MNGRIFTIAGSDPGGGAGIQADIKTISALGGYAMAAITALTVQNTVRVYDVHPVEAAMVSAQVTAVLEDIMPDAVKIGMMATVENTRQLAGIFSEYNDIPLILDPVILSTSGHGMLEPEGLEILIADLLPRLDVLTPNLAEAALIAGLDNIDSLSGMVRAGEKILSMGPKAVLVKGGHLPGDNVADILITEKETYEFSSPKIPTRNTHGTGCTLASAIATGLGQGMRLEEAVRRAHKYVHKAISEASGYGSGKGPLNHSVILD